MRNRDNDQNMSELERNATESQRRILNT